MAMGAVRMALVLLGGLALGGCGRREPAITVEIVAAGEAEPQLRGSMAAPGTALGHVETTAPGPVKILPTGTRIRGAWRIELMHEGRALARQDFTVEVGR